MHKKTVKLCGIAIVLILVFTVVISSNSFTKTAKAEDTPTSETSVNSGSDIHEQTLATDFNSNEEPMITFFTHGMAGDSGHWSNKLHRENGQYTTEKAFYNCTSLYYVSLPDNITDIFAETFAYTRLRTINLPRDLSEIGPGAFSNTELTSVTIPEGTRYIDYQAFENCIDLQRVSLPNTIRYISTFAFANCSDLEQIKLPENITEISNYTFKNCSSLTQINIPEKVTKIGKEAFSGCVKLAQKSSALIIYNGNLIEYVVNDLAYAIDSLKILMDTRQDELVLLQMGICDAIWYADQQTIAEIIEQFVNGDITDNVYYKPFTKVDIYNVDQYL